MRPIEQDKMMQDNDITHKKFQKELNSGITALVLLAILDRATEPMYGYQIAKQIDADSSKAPVKQGALYPVLRGLEGEGLLESRVEPSVSGPPRKYYRITDAGRSTLEEWKDIWEQTCHFVDWNLRGNNDD